MATATTMVVGPKPFPSEPPPTRQKTEFDLSSSADANDDLYSRLKMLQRQHEFIEIQEEYVKDELKNLRRELLRSQEEVKRIQSVPLHIRVFLPRDITHRITAEAEDVADTVYNLLNLSAMATQMLVISHILSLVSALVIPSMALSVGCLEERLRSLSNKANISTAALSAYLNEVFPSILFVKANNAEANERIRFQSLASADLSACLKKKQMKVLFSQIVQIMFIGVLFVFGAISLVVSRVSFNCSATVSFSTSLILLIEPIQSAFDKALTEHKDIDDVVGLEEPTERDHGVDLQQPLLIKIDSSDSHQK
ncbi:hypothetical protein OROMI_020605 [Orobanche minor]